MEDHAKILDLIAGIIENNKLIYLKKTIIGQNMFFF